MEDAPSPVGNARAVRFILVAAGRAILFALAGAVFMAVTGAVVGYLTGIASAVLLKDSPIGTAIFSTNATFTLLDRAAIGMIFGAYYGTVTGGTLGAIAFCTVGVMASFGADSNSILQFSLQRALRGSLVGTLLGAFIGSANGLLLVFVVSPSYLSSIGIVMSAREFLGIGLLIGIELGFTIGVMYCSIKGALTEVRRQRDGQLQSAT